MLDLSLAQYGGTKRKKGAPKRQEPGQFPKSHAGRRAGAGSTGATAMQNLSFCRGGPKSESPKMIRFEKDTKTGYRLTGHPSRSRGRQFSPNCHSIFCIHVGCRLLPDRSAAGGQPARTSGLASSLVSFRRARFGSRTDPTHSTTPPNPSFKCNHFPLTNFLHPRFLKTIHPVFKTYFASISSKWSHACGPIGGKRT